jgi:dipeptidyl aminopeptidase/acylaminoacyl peptidase
MNPRFLALILFLGAPTLPAQTPALNPDSALVTEGIPPIPAGVAAAADRYTESRAAFVQSWHPTKREMLITTRFGDTNQVHRVRFPGGARTQLTFFPDRVLAASYPRHADSYFVFVKDTGGNEFSQLYRYDLPTGTITLLTDGKSQNGLGPFSHAGDRMVYGSTRRDGKDRDLYVIDPREPKSDRLLAELDGGGWYALDWSPDDRTVLVNQGISANESYLWLMDSATGARKLLTPRKAGDTVAYGGGRFTPDGKGLYVTTDRESEFHRLAHVDLASGAHTYISTVPWDVDAFDLSPDGRILAFVTNEGGVDVLHLLDTATGKERPAPKLPVGLIGALRWHPNGKDLAFTLSSVRSPADAYSLDATTGALERWTESETGGIAVAALADPELIRWTSFDGRTISGFLYRPPARFPGRRPVVINIHGGPEGQARPGFLGRLTYYLDELGLVLITPNVRGSSGYGKTFLKLDNGYSREDAVKDIGALLDWIKTRPDLDSDRVMVTGGSYGGYMTLAVATHYDDRIRCSVDVVGISNFVSFLERTEAYRRDLRRVEYGDERDPKMREFLLGISPLNQAQKITKPLFVVAGKNDPRVPFQEGEQMVATVRKNATPVWYLLAKDEGHGFAKKKNADFQFYATAAFAQEYLLK